MIDSRYRFEYFQLSSLQKIARDNYTRVRCLVINQHDWIITYLYIGISNRAAISLIILEEMTKFIFPTSKKEKKRKRKRKKKSVDITRENSQSVRGNKRETWNEEKGFEKKTKDGNKKTNEAMSICVFFFFFFFSIRWDTTFDSDVMLVYHGSSQ